MESFTWSIGAIDSELRFYPQPQPIPIAEITAFKPDATLQNFQVFAEEEYNIGLAWYCEDTRSGKIYRVDPEHGTRIVLINASKWQLLQSINACVTWSNLHSTKALQADSSPVSTLESTLLNINACSSTSHWQTILNLMHEALTDTWEDDDLNISLTST